MKKLTIITSIIFTLIMLASAFIPTATVIADDGKSAELSSMEAIIGVKIPKDNYTSVMYTGNHSTDINGKERYEYISEFSVVPIYNDDGTAIDCKFKDKSAKSDGSSFEIVGNIFNVSIEGSAVTISYNGKSMSWNPVIYVDAKEYVAKGNPNKPTKNIAKQWDNENVLEWDYGICIRRITVTAGQLKEEYIFDKDPKGTVWIKENANIPYGFLIEGAGFTIETPYAYDAKNNPLVINEYKQIDAKQFESAVYPVVIDPTVNYGYSSMASLIGWGADYSTVHAQASANYIYTSPDWLGQRLYSGYYGICRYAVISDTSGLPDDCTITAAYMYLGVWTDGTVHDFYLSVYSGSSATYPHDPPVVGDYDRNYTGTYYGQTWCTGASINIDFNAAGLAAISKTGTSKYYIRSVPDIAASAPDTDEYIVAQPSLYVTYIASAVPTVTTSAASSVGETSCQGNGEVTADNGDVITRRGFCYKVGVAGDPTTADSTAYDDGSWNEGTFFKTISGLSGGTSYRVRAYAINSYGTGYGTSVTVLTIPAAPTSVAATDGTYTSKVVVTWTKSTGASGYYIYQGGAYLNTVGDVATYDDTGAGAPSITAGSASASDGTSTSYVTCTVTGESASNGASRTYTVYAYDATGTSSVSNSNTGYRGTTTLTYQWYRSAADSDASYGSVGGGTTDPYNDTGAPADYTGRYWKCLVSMTDATSQYTTANRGYRIAVPTVTTQNATVIESTTCTGNGNITATNGENSTRRGFCYMVGVAGDPTTANSTAYDDGSFGTGAYNKSISSLTAGTNYRIRAYAVNSFGTGYGTTVQILTKPAAPTNVAASDGTSTTNVTVTWTKSTGATGYYVFEGSNLLATLGDVATYNDSAAGAPTITAGTASASDGTSGSYVTCAVSSESASNGASRTYKVKAFSATGNSSDSATDTGYRGTTTLTYQWMRSAANSDADYSNIAGGTTDPYNDTGAPADGSVRYFKAAISMVGATSANTSVNTGYRSVVQTLTTSAATSIEETTCTGNGEITNNGGNLATRRGFCYMVGVAGDPTTANSVAYDDGTYDVGAFTKSITGLATGTSYRVRAYSENSAGTGYGTTVQIQTKPAAPTNVAASDGTSTTNVTVTWTKSTGATGYYVFEGSNLLATLGDVATYNDSNAGAPSITAGTASASDGTYPAYVLLSIAGDTPSNGASRTYKVKAFDATGNSSDSSTDTGYRGTMNLSYQWRISTADSDATYSDVAGGTTDPYNDAAAPVDGTGRFWKCNVSMAGATTVTTNADRGYILIAPVVVTQNATYVAKTSARMNGYLSTDGGGGSANVSFKYALWNGSAWGANTSTSNQTKSSGQTFYEDLTGLTNASTYRFITVATNNYGTTYGSWLNFTTPNVGYAPVNVSCSATSSTITISWTKHDSSNTYIRYKMGDYPTDFADGYILPLQSGVDYTHTGLVSGQTYYYKLWGENAGEYSTDNSTTMCSVTAGYTSNTTGTLPASNTSTWNETPNGSVLENNPLYGLGNEMADETGIPHNTWWLILGMGALVVAGLFVYSRTKNLMLAMIVMIIVGAIIAEAGIFPIWTLYIFGLAGLGMSWKELR